MSIEAMKQALEALEMVQIDVKTTPNAYETQRQAINTLRQAIAEAEKQEPVSCPYCKNWATLGAVYYDQNCAECVMRMNHPPKQWVGLTDEEIKPLCDENHIIYGAYTVDFIQSIEAKLKEKNHG